MDADETGVTGAAEEATTETGDDEDADRRARVAVMAFAIVLSGIATAAIFSIEQDIAVTFSPAVVSIAVAVLYVLAELYTVDLELRRESHTFAFSAVPLVVGLLLLGPVPVAVIRLGVSLVILGGVRRQPPYKLVANLATHLTEVAVAAAILALLPRGGDVDLTVWAVTFAAVIVADLAAAVVVTLVIRLYVGVWEPLLWEGIWSGSLLALVDVSLALVVVTLAQEDLASVWLLVTVGAFLVVVSRAYAALRSRYRSLGLLDDYTRRLGRAVSDGSPVTELLDRTGEILHSEATWLVLRDGDDVRRVELGPDGTAVERAGTDLDRHLLEAVGHGRRQDDQAAARHLTADGAPGDPLEPAGLRELIAAPALVDDTTDAVLVVGDRSGDLRTWDRDDVALFETLAVHAGVSLRNADLLDRLRQEARANEVLARTDTLTGLANRRDFSAHVAARLDGDHRFAVAVLDIDRFREINDTLGHEFGDTVLVEVGRRLAATPGVDHLARLGGNEFAAVVEADGPEEAVAAARALRDALAETVSIGSLVLDITASVGVALAGPGAGDEVTLLRRADVAMYNAKDARTGIELYSVARDRTDPGRLTLLADLRAAIEERTLELHYQPVVRFDTGEVAAVEALLRWTHAERGPIPPDVFIPMAEISGLIRPLTQLVLETAVAQAARWRAAGSPLQVSINISSDNTAEADLIDRIAAELAAHDLPPDALKVELTESAAMVDPDVSMAMMAGLAASGVPVAIDDFGTGYSSLSYLTMLPAHQLKIDRSFVRDLGTDRAAESVVRAIVDLGRSLDLEIVAEGIESAVQLDVLRAGGCTLGQGYLFSRPLPAEAFDRWRAHRSTATAV
jgi:diguanylate cyclase (GGDEF)-like protein